MADLDPGVDVCKHGGDHYLLLYSLHNDKNQDCALQENLRPK